MSDIFSHPVAAAIGDPQSRADLNHSVDVPAGIDHAWAGLTEHLHLWWPADELSRWGADSFFDLEDNALVETSAQDDENVWGEMTDGRPGQWVELRWREVGSASSTHVRFDLSPLDRTSPSGTDTGTDRSAEGAVSTLSVTHHGWTAEDSRESYTFYEKFWPLALARYRRFMGGS